MFTGLIERIGTVKRVSRGRGLTLEFIFKPWLNPLELGESVAVNGACLTVSGCGTASFAANVLRETESRTNLAELKPGDKVNLERALRAGDRFGGHIVQGHVDCVGELMSKTQKGRDFAFTFRCGRVVAASSVIKGSIAINGVSLTISGLGEDWLQVDIIPTTLKDTNLGLLSVGDRVNLETDVLGKYARRYSDTSNADDGEDPPENGGGLTMQFLADNGFV